MTRLTLPDYKALKTHRGWEDWLSIGLGFVLILSPMLVEGQIPDPTLVNMLIIAILVMSLGMIEIMMAGRWEEIIQFALGLWLAVSIFVLDYGVAVTLRPLYFVIGALVALMAAFELWQDTRQKT